MGDGQTSDWLSIGLRAPNPHARRAADAPASLSPIQRRVLELQSGAGNTAVARALARRPVVQRDKAPAWVKEAQKEFKSLFPKEKLMEGVVIKDYGDLNETLQGMGYGAWTQSKAEIYLRDPMSLEGVTKKNKRSIMRFTLQHEANHIRQFSTAKGPPTKWADMLRFEIEAYTNDKKWLAANGKTEIPDAKLRAMLVKGTNENLAHAVEMQKAAAKETDAESFLYDEMKRRDFIPKDAAKDPGALYKQD